MTASLQKIDFATQSYQSPDLPLCAQRIVNWYPEIMPAGADQKTKLVLRRTPGTLPFCDTEKNEVFGTHYFDAENLMYSVAGNKLFTINSTGTKTEVGTLGTITAPIQMLDNGFEVVTLLQNGAAYYSVGGITNQITDPNFPAASSLAILDGFLIATEIGTNKFSASRLNSSIVWPPLSFDNARASPDILVRAIATSKELWLFGTRTCEIWVNVGAANFPFEPLNNTVIDRGCAAKLAVVATDDRVYWLGSDRVIYTNEGYSAKPISTEAIEQTLAGFRDVSNAFAYSRNQNGQTFISFTFPSDNLTLVYSPDTGLWHNQASIVVDQRYRANSIVQCFNKTFIGDSLSGNIFELSIPTCSEGDDLIIREATGVYLWDSFNWIIYERFFVDLKTGAAPLLTQDPKILLSFSDDNGYTFPFNYPKSIGLRGAWKRIVDWTRLGRARSRCFRLTYSEPVDTIIMGAYVSASIGPAL